MPREMFIQDPREEKLPRWVQDRLAEARRRVREAEAGALEARLGTKPEDSLVIVEKFDTVPIGLGDAQVAFKPSLGVDWTRFITVRVLNGGIEISGNSGPLVITPVASNVVRIKIGE